MFLQSNQDRNSNYQRSNTNLSRPYDTNPRQQPQSVSSNPTNNVPNYRSDQIPSAHAFGLNSTNSIPNRRLPPNYRHEEPVVVSSNSINTSNSSSLIQSSGLNNNIPVRRLPPNYKHEEPVVVSSNSINTSNSSSLTQSSGLNNNIPVRRKLPPNYKHEEPVVVSSNSTSTSNSSSLTQSSGLNNNIPVRRKLPPNYKHQEPVVVSSNSDLSQITQRQPVIEQIQPLTENSSCQNLGRGRQATTPAWMTNGVDVNSLQGVIQKPIVSVQTVPNQLQNISSLSRSNKEKNIETIPTEETKVQIYVPIIPISFKIMNYKASFHFVLILTHFLLFRTNFVVFVEIMVNF